MVTADQTDFKLIHKSRKYADKILDHLGYRKIHYNENYIREMIFQCWEEAWTIGLQHHMSMMRESNTPVHHRPDGSITVTPDANPENV